VTAHRVATLSETPAGSLRRVVVEGQPICLARLADGSLCAIDDICTHEEESLAEGELDGQEIECPAHFARFDLRTGEVVAPPAIMPARVYDVTIDGDDIVVEV
jgi:3-phenylpropionate/trans-cinnamate dioxygenase ferredoxin subunit